VILFLTLIHITVALLLVGFVLIQDTKGGGVFGMGGGGGSNQVMSSTGAANFLVKATRTLGIIFAATSIALTYLTSKHGGSVTDTYIPPPAASAPAAPAAPGAPAAADAAAPAKSTADASTPGKATDAGKPAEAPKGDN